MKKIFPVKRHIQLTEEGDRLAYLKQRYAEEVKKKSPRHGAPAGPEGEDSDFDLLVASDPTSKPNYAGKYSEWIIRNYIKDTEGHFIEDLPLLASNLDLFNRFKERFPADRRDINKLTAHDLILMGEQVQQAQAAKAAEKEREARAKGKISSFTGGANETEKEKQEREFAYANIKELYSDENVHAYQPLRMEASIYFETHDTWGKSRATTDCKPAIWCTGWPKERSMWKQYNENGDYLVIFDYRSSFRAQLEVKSNRSNTQLKDRHNSDIQITTLLDNYKGGHMDEFIKWLATFTNIRHHAAKLRSGYKSGSSDKPELNTKEAELGAKFFGDLSKESEETLYELARANNLSRAELDQLVALNPPPEDISKFDRVQRNLLRYQQLSDVVLEKALAHKTDLKIRMNAGANPYLPAHLQLKIAKGSDQPARVGLINNRNLTKEAEAILKKDTELSRLMANKRKSKNA
jgi:hypothetical protein